MCGKCCRWYVPTVLPPLPPSPPPPPPPPLLLHAALFPWKAKANRHRWEYDALCQNWSVCSQRQGSCLSRDSHASLRQSVACDVTSRPSFSEFADQPQRPFTFFSLGKARTRLLLQLMCRNILVRFNLSFCGGCLEVKAMIPTWADFLWCHTCSCVRVGEPALS